jgi:hypothetical protein
MNASIYVRRYIAVALLGVLAVATSASAECAWVLKKAEDQGA